MQFSNCLLAAGLVALTACDNQPASTNPTTGSPKPPARGTVSTAAIPQPPTEVSAGPESGDVPLLHEPFTHIKEVAPGLQVQVSSVPVADTAVVRKPSDLRLVLTIIKNQRVIFRDTVADGLAYTEYSEPQTKRLYPIWVPMGPAEGQLLVAYNNRPSKDRARRIHIRGNKVIGIDTLLTFDGPARDLDHDGRLEYGGRANYGESTSDSRGRALSFYNPVLYYELRPAGLVLDSALTRHQAIAEYGSFHGYKYSERFSFPVKRP
jgi:hypothetical protein